MTENADSLETRLRDRARKALEKEIDDALKPIEKLARTARAIVLDGVYSTDKSTEKHFQCDIFDVTKAIRKALVGAYREAREDDEIENFMNKVDDLQAQLDELKQG